MAVMFTRVPTPLRMEDSHADPIAPDTFNLYRGARRCDVYPIIITFLLWLGMAYNALAHDETRPKPQAETVPMVGNRRQRKKER